MALIIDDIIDNLRKEYYTGAHRRASTLSAEELAVYWNNGSESGPALYPISRLLDAYALSGMLDFQNADKIIDEETGRTIPEAYAMSQPSFILLNYIALACTNACTNETSGRPNLGKGIARFEELLEKAARHAAKHHPNPRQNEYLIQRGMLRDQVTELFGIPKVADLVTIQLPTLLEKFYALVSNPDHANLKGIFNRNDRYEMPRPRTFGLF